MGTSDYSRLFQFVRDLGELVNDDGVLCVDVDCFLYDLARVFDVSPQVLFMFFYSSADVDVGLAHLRKVEG